MVAPRQRRKQLEIAANKSFFLFPSPAFDLSLCAIASLIR
jgi:hypothetical protein